MPELPVHPARAQVLITKPVEGLKLRGSFHYDAGYYYFRNVGNRVLLGGGRHLDFEGEETMEMKNTPFIMDRLHRLLQEMILPGIAYEEEMRWSGIMGVGPEKKYVLEQVSPNVFVGVRMGGMGVALGSLVGLELSELACNTWDR
jgi:gamma-glutamylputrescine oxidase